MFETVEVFERSILASLWEHQQHVNVVVGDSAAAGLFYVCVFFYSFPPRVRSDGEFSTLCSELIILFS